MYSELDLSLYPLSMYCSIGSIVVYMYYIRHNDMYDRNGCMDPKAGVLHRKTPGVEHEGCRPTKEGI